METQPRSRPVCQHLGLGPNTTTISARRHCDVPRAPSCPSPSATVAVQPQRQVPRSLKGPRAVSGRKGEEREGEAADRISRGSALGRCVCVCLLYFYKEDSDLKRARCLKTAAARKPRARLQLLVHTPKRPGSPGKKKTRKRAAPPKTATQPPGEHLADHLIGHGLPRHPRRLFGAEAQRPQSRRKKRRAS